MIQIQFLKRPFQFYPFNICFYFGPLCQVSNINYKNMISSKDRAGNLSVYDQKVKNNWSATQYCKSSCVALEELQLQSHQEWLPGHGVPDFHSQSCTCGSFFFSPKLHPSTKQSVQKLASLLLYLSFSHTDTRIQNLKLLRRF